MVPVPSWATRSKYGRVKFYFARSLFGEEVGITRSVVKVVEDRNFAIAWGDMLGVSPADALTYVIKWPNFNPLGVLGKQNEEVRCFPLMTYPEKDLTMLPVELYEVVDDATGEVLSDSKLIEEVDDEHGSWSAPATKNKEGKWEFFRGRTYIGGCNCKNLQIRRKLS